MDRARITFFSKGDNKFLTTIVEYLNKSYETKLITIGCSRDYSLIDQWMAWADISWFEWCDELVEYGSKHKTAKEKKIVCRLHSYEAFTYYPTKVNWENVDKLVLISKSIQSYILETYKINADITEVIPNGVDLQQLNFRERDPGFKLAYVGYINFKKGPMLLLQTFKALFDSDKRFKLYMAGSYQDPRYLLYFNQMVKEMGLSDSVFFEGWQADIDKWLEDKDYIICSSVLESQNMSIMQAMAKGIKPVIHNFVGARGIYPGKYLWNTIDEAVAMIKAETYSSEEYRTFIQDNYEISKQCKKITSALDSLWSSQHKAADQKNHDYRNYIIDRMNEFVSYTTDDYDLFNFDNSKIVLGKVDRTVAGTQLLEFILKDKQDNMLVINNIWANKINNDFDLPSKMKKSINSEKIIALCRECLSYPVTYKYGVGGFVFDAEMQQDIEKNYIAYMWERGIPASEFLPLSVYMRIVERYIFTSDYIPRDGCILEAPCGFGYGAAYLSKKCRQVEALDIAKDNIAFANLAYKHPNINWTIGDVTELPYEDDMFDAYVSFEVFEHLPEDIAIKHIEEAYRVLKPGGSFLISTPNREMRRNVHNPFHTKEYNFDEFQSILKRVFEPIEFYSMVNSSIEKGINQKAYVMLAVCRKNKMPMPFRDNDNVG